MCAPALVWIGECLIVEQVRRASSYDAGAIAVVTIHVHVPILDKKKSKKRRNTVYPVFDGTEKGSALAGSGRSALRGLSTPKKRSSASPHAQRASAACPTHFLFDMEQEANLGHGEKESLRRPPFVKTPAGQTRLSAKKITSLPLLFICEPSCVHVPFYIQW